MNTDAHEGYAPRRPTADDDARLGAEVDRAGHLIDSGDHAGAVTALGDVLGWAESLYGPGDPDVLLVRGELGRALGRLGRHHEAVDVLGPGVVLARELGPDDAQTRSDLITSLVDALEASGRGEETPALERELADVHVHEPGPAAHGRAAEPQDGSGYDVGPGIDVGAGYDAGSGYDAGAGYDTGAGADVAAGGAGDDEYAVGMPPEDGTGGPVRADADADADENDHAAPTLRDDLRAATVREDVGVDEAQDLVARADTPADRQLLPDALLLLAEAHSRAGDTAGAVDAHAHRSHAVASLDGPTSGTALRASARHVTALVEAGQLDEALDANMFLGRDARRHRPDDLELADIATARSADLLAAKGRFHEARQVFAELVSLRISRAGIGPDHLSTLDARHREAWATLEVDPATALSQFEALSADLERLLPPDHPLVGQAANGAEEARSDLGQG